MKLKPKSYLTLVLILSTGCGVKGLPQATGKPENISHGQLQFTKVSQDLKLKKKKPVKRDGDFSEGEDFQDKEFDQ